MGEWAGKRQNISELHPLIDNMFVKVIQHLIKLSWQQLNVISNSHSVQFQHSNKHTKVKDFSHFYDNESLHLISRCCHTQIKPIDFTHFKEHHFTLRDDNDSLGVRLMESIWIVNWADSIVLNFLKLNSYLRFQLSLKRIKGKQKHKELWIVLYFIYISNFNVHINRNISVIYFQSTNSLKWTIISHHRQRFI